MAAKSVIAIDVQDQAFRDFNELFDKYRANLAKLPGSWGKQADEARLIGAAMTAALSSAKKLTDEEKKAAQAEKEATQAAEKRRKAWETLRKDSAEFAKNIAGATFNILKWVTVTGFMGAIGAGAGFFGVNRLAERTAGNYRAAMGLGVSTGEAKSFDVNYGRYVDTNSYLASVNEALHDQSKRWTLLAAGLREDQLRGRSTAEVAQDLLPMLRQRFKQSGETMQGAQAYGLTQFAGLEDLLRLSKTSDSELGASREQYEKDKQALALSDETQKKWRDFNTQLDRAKEVIANVFVDTLTPLVDPFMRLSKGVAEALKGFVQAPQFKQWIEEAGTAIQKFSKYLLSPEFKADMDKFTRNVQRTAEVVGVLGDKIYAFMQKLGWLKTEEAPIAAGERAHNPYQFTKDQRKALDELTFRAPLTKGKLIDYANAPWDDKLREEAEASLKESSGGVFGQAINYWIKQAGLSPSAIRASWEQQNPAPAAPPIFSGGSGNGNTVAEQNNNPGNLRSWGKNPIVNGFAAFKSTDEGLSAMAKQLKLYQNRDHLDTISALITKYAPPSENDTASYIGDVTKRTGFGAKDKVNLNDPETLASIMYAMVKHESIRTPVTMDQVSQAAGASGMYRQPVIIQINNNTGGSAIVSTSQLAQ